MSAGDWAVIAAGLVLGYVVVSMLLGGKKNVAPAAAGAATPPLAPDESPTWPDVLGVPASASDDEIRAAYRHLIGQYHPDKVASLGPELRELAERKSKEIAAAYAAARQARGFE